MKNRVLILAGYYLPSIKGGGPIQSIKNIIDNLSDKFEFYVVAADRDLGDSQQFKNIEINKWIKIGKANVYYVNIAELTWKGIIKIVNDSCCNVLYLNSFFDYKFAILPIILKKINKIKVKKIIIAPRGQFFPGALRFKSCKKKLFIKMSKVMGLCDNVIWHATSDSEKRYIQLVFGNRINIKVADNLTENYSENFYEKNIKKAKGELSVVFISRIHPKKNLKQAIKFFRNVSGKISFNIYGPIEDQHYWAECKKEIAALPTNIDVKYRGIVDHDEVIDVFKKHHVFLFPTLGENFGHVIFEALMGGCVLIISDQTPWNNLEELEIGWDLGIESTAEYVDAIQECVFWDDEKYSKYSKKAFMYGLNKSKDSSEILKHQELFNF